MTDSPKIGFAILGAGMVADYHRQAIRANAELGAHLVAVGHYNPARFDAIGAGFGVPCVSQDDLLADPAVDVICICTPSGQHAAQAIAAARAGKHVLVEKPMALNTRDADAIITACDEAGVKLGVVVQRRATPLYRTIYEAIQSGDLGDLTLGVVTIPYFRPESYFAQAAWRGTWALDGGGVLMNQGIHLVDLLIWYMGDPVDVQAYAATLHRPIEVEDTLAATLRFANGALATITAATTAGSGYPHRLEVYGTHGGIRTEGDTLADWSLVDPHQAVIMPPNRAALSGKTPDTGAGGDPRGIKADDHAALFRDFIQAIRADRLPLADGQEGRRSVAAVTTIYQAAGILDSAV